VLNTLKDIRQITERNAQGVKSTLSATTELTELARGLFEMTDEQKPRASSANGTEKAVPKARSVRKSRSQESKVAKAPAAPDGEQPGE
jgi:hypothetical protein